MRKSPYLLILVLAASALAIIPTNPGDLNADNRVDVSDVFLVVGCLGQNAATCQSGRADPNNDGAVNIYDFITVSRSWGASYSGAVNLANECNAPQAGWLWCDDFEANRLASYFEYDDGANNDFIRIAGTGVSSSTAMRSHLVPNANQYNGGGLKVAFGKTPGASFEPVDAGTQVYRDIYWRMYVKNQAGWVQTGVVGDKLSRAVVFSASDWRQAAIAHVWGANRGPNYIMIEPVSLVNTNSQVTSTQYNDFDNFQWIGSVDGNFPIYNSANVGQWRCVEAHMKLNDPGQSNGVEELWIDGTLDAQSTGLNYVKSYTTYGINAVLFENFWNIGPNVAQDRWMDNLVVSTQRIGCGSAPTTPAATASISASPTSITSGGSSALTWSSTNAASCTASGSWSGSKATSGSQSVSPTSTSTYTLTCTGTGGTSSPAGATVTVNAANPAPVVTLSANPSSITSGNSATLTWTVSSATSCTASGAWSGSKTATGGSQSVSPTSTSTYTLSCTGTGGTTQQGTTVTVTTGGGSGNPTPETTGGTIAFDTRAGGAQSWQAAGMTDIAALRSVFDEDISRSIDTYNTNVDGAGTNARTTTWKAQSGSEQSSIMNKYVVGSGIIPGSDTRGWYFQWKRRLNPGYVYNSNGQGIKDVLFLRARDNSGDPNRIYMVENNGGYNFQIDATSYTSHPSWDRSLTPGVIETVTVFIKPGNGNGQIKVWRNGVQEMNLVNEDLGTGGLAQFQVLVAAFVPSVSSRDDWDYVLWVPPATDSIPPTASITAPTASQIFTAGTTSVTLSATTNEAATCKYSTTNQTYASMPTQFGTTGSTSHSTSITVANGQPYTYYVRCQDTAGNAMTSSQSRSFSVATASSGATYPNQPAGYSRIAEIDFNKGLPGISTGSSVGTTLAGNAARSSGSEVTIDPTISGPQSPGGTIRGALTSGTGGHIGFTWALWDSQFSGDHGDPGGEYSKIYISRWVRYGGAPGTANEFNYENQAVGTKMQFVWAGGPAGATSSQDFFMVVNNAGVQGVYPSGTYELWQQRPDDIYGGSGHRELIQNIDSTKYFTAGTWHHTEVVMEINSIGSRNGVYKAWIDGHLISNYNDVEYRTAANSAKFKGFGGTTGYIWGGTGGSKSRADYFWEDHIYISAIQ